MSQATQTALAAPHEELVAPLLRLEGLSRHYRMGESIVRALDGIDLGIRVGEFLTIVGASGSGKSTLMHILGCLDSPTEGSQWVRGEDVSTYSDNRLSSIRNRRIGFVFQQFNLLRDLTVIENIALPLAYSGVPRAQRQAAARRYAEMLGLGDRLEHRPTELSGGQAQRVAIARALVNEPDILLADEPTGNLDSKTGHEILQILHDLNERGLTVIMVTHDAEHAAQGTRRVTVRDGRILADERLRPPPAGPIEAEHDGPTQERHGLSLLDLVRIGTREGLLCHKMRTALTMLGILIGVAAVISMSSFSLGSKQKQINQIRALGANLMRVIDKQLEGEALTNARRRGSDGLSREDLALIRANIEQVQRASAMRELKVNTLFGNRSLSPRVIGVDGDYFRVNNLSLAAGRPINEGDQHRSARVAIVGSAIARQMGVEEPLGERILLGGDPYRVIGVLESKQIDTKELEATSLNDSNYDLIIPLNTLLHRTTFLELRNEIDEINLQLETEDDLLSAGTEVKRLLLAAHNGVEDFEIVIPMNLLKQKQQAQRLLDVLTILISSIALVVGGIGIMNIMLAAVTERIREIGIRRAVGATRRDITYQFLSEAVLISITGGLVGAGLALVSTLIVCHLIDIPFVVSPGMVAIAIGAAVTIGLVFGWYPARQAAHKDPVEALRYE